MVFKKGEIPWNKGRKTGKIPLQIRKKMSESHKGKKKPWARNNGIKTRFKKNKNPWNKGLKGKQSHRFGYKMSKKTKEKIRKSQLKEKGNNWKGGKSSMNQLIRKSTKFKEWRKAVFERDNYTCQECGFRNGKGKHRDLHPHHIKYLSEYPELAYEVENGQTLCKDCHLKKHPNLIKKEALTGKEAIKV